MSKHETQNKTNKQNNTDSEKSGKLNFDQFKSISILAPELVEALLSEIRPPQREIKLTNKRIETR
jgi:hypothetical protein